MGPPHTAHKAGLRENDFHCGLIQSRPYDSALTFLGHAECIALAWSRDSIGASYIQSCRIYMSGLRK